MALDFELSEEQKTLYAGAKEWAQENFDFTLARKWDEEHQHPRELWSRAAKLGYVAPTVEPKYGGQGIGVLDYCLILEAFTSVDLTCGMTMYTTQFGSEQIERFGTEEQKMKYLTKTCGGEWVCCAGYTEPNAGSDLQAITTRATRDGNEWVINGEKIFATNSPIADWGVFLIRTSPPEKPRSTKGISILLVDDVCRRKDINLIDLGRKMGVNTTITGQVAFNDCRIPVENIVGEEGKGFYQAMSFFDLTRCYVAAMSLGASEAALEKTINYVKQRIQFGVPVASHEWIQFRLTEDATRIEAGRLLLYRAARVVDLGQPNLTWSSMAKYYCTEEVAERVLWDAIQYHGGYGYIYDFDVERWYRDNRIQEIWEGTNEIQRYTIARAILGKF